jgi:hypothetical protein
MISENPVRQYIRSCPAFLESPIGTIHQAFPSLLEEVSREVSEPIGVKLVVDLQVEDNTVRFQDLKDRNISVEGILPNAKGRVSIDELAKKNIVIAEESAPAWWEWSDKLIYVAHSSYEHCAKELQLGEQVYSLLFEVGNAFQSRKFKELIAAKRSLSALEFVRKFEKIEFETTSSTKYRLRAMGRHGMFHKDFNYHVLSYDDSQLNFLYQQVAGHAFNIAERFGFGRSFQGTWYTKFVQDSPKHQLVMEKLSKILSAHLRAIDSENRTKLDALVQDVKAKAELNQPWARMVLANLWFFEGKYQAYVKRENVKVSMSILSEKPAFFVEPMQTKGFFQSIADAFRAIRA